MANIRGQVVVEVWVVGRVLDEVELGEVELVEVELVEVELVEAELVEVVLVVVELALKEMAKMVEVVVEVWVVVGGHTQLEHFVPLHCLVHQALLLVVVEALVVVVV